MQDSVNRNSLIDGLRGLSVTLVVVGHLFDYRLGSDLPIVPLRRLITQESSIFVVFENIFIRVANYSQELATVGVDVFFIISGFLITSILLSEEYNNGKINIRAFYVRRLFRIMPAFYAMLLATILLGSLKLINLPADAAWRSGLYICNLSDLKCSWWLAHTWSLGVEEQFYLIWPAMFFMPLKFRRAIIALLAACLPILIYLVPSLHGFQYITAGALVASFSGLLEVICRLPAKFSLNTALVAVLALHLVIFVSSIFPLLEIFQPALLVLLIFNAIRGRGLLAKVVSARALQKIGLVSYSVYLWQQMSLAPSEFAGKDTGASTYLHQNPVYMCIFLFAAPISYYLLERPLIALSHELSKKIIRGSNVGALDHAGALHTINPSETFPN